jgi:hypothetical protein
MFHGCTGGPHHGWWTKRCRLRRLSLVTSFTLCSHGFLMAGNWGNGWRSQGWLKDEILVLWKYLVELRIYLHIYIYIYTWISTIGPDVMFKFLSLVQTYIYIYMFNWSQMSFWCSTMFSLRRVQGKSRRKMHNRRHVGFWWLNQPLGQRQHPEWIKPPTGPLSGIQKGQMNVC